MWKQLHNSSWWCFLILIAMHNIVLNIRGGVPQINVHWIVFERIVLLIRYFLFGDERLNKHWIIINQNTNTKCTLSEMLKAQIPWNCTVFTLTAYSQKWSYHSCVWDLIIHQLSMWGLQNLVLLVLQITEMGLVSVQDLHYIVLLI